MNLIAKLEIIYRIFRTISHDFFRKFCGSGFQHALGLHIPDVQGQLRGDRCYGISTGSMPPASW